jgi:broad specificity phosphatase PhoE
VEIYLLRHGQTPQTGTYTGRSNVQLSAEGTRQITVLAPFLKSIQFDTCICSPLDRCVQSLALLGVDSEPVYDESLREIDFGSWEGLSFEQIEKEFPDQLADWVRSGDQFNFPGGDTIRVFNSRIGDWLDDLLTRDLNRVLIVTHGGVIRIAICHLLGLDTSRAFGFNPMEGRVSMVRVTGDFGLLELFNCTG